MEFYKLKLYGRVKFLNIWDNFGRKEKIKGRKEELVYFFLLF